jgi:predicted aspartyl protease
VQIPQLTVVLTQEGRNYPLRGSIDTGYDGMAVIRPALATRLRIPTVGWMKLSGFGGTNTVPVGRVDALGIQDSPACSLKDAQVVITEIPGNDDILLGEEFFKQFQFDINYREGRPLVIACGQRVSMLSSFTSSPWFIPAVALGGLLLVGGIFSLFMAVEPERSAHD